MNSELELLSITTATERLIHRFIDRAAAPWYLQNSNAGYTGYQFSVSTDVPIPAYYDGDGKSDIAVYRPQAGDWYQLRTTTNVFSSASTATTFFAPSFAAAIAQAPVPAPMSKTTESAVTHFFSAL